MNKFFEKKCKRIEFKNKNKNKNKNKINKQIFLMIFEASMIIFNISFNLHTVFTSSVIIHNLRTKFKNEQVFRK